MVNVGQCLTQILTQLGFCKSTHDESNKYNVYLSGKAKLTKTSGLSEFVSFCLFNMSCINEIDIADVTNVSAVRSFYEYLRSTGRNFQFASVDFLQI